MSASHTETAPHGAWRRYRGNRQIAAASNFTSTYEALHETHVMHRAKSRRWAHAQTAQILDWEDMVRRVAPQFNLPILPLSDSRVAAESDAQTASVHGNEGGRQTNSPSNIKLDENSKV